MTKPTEHWPVRLTSWKNLIRITRPSFGTVPASGVRGCVAGLSPAARRRLSLTIAEANVDPALFVTLTYGEKHPTVRGSKEDLRIWWQGVQRHLARRGIRAAMVWRLELQKRGAPHYHLLIWHDGRSQESLALSLPGSFGVTARSHWDRIRLRLSGSQRLRPGSRLDWLLMLSATWYTRCEAFTPGAQKVLLRCVDVRTVSDRRQVAGYVSKYVAKPDRERGSTTPDPRMVGGGRVWGLRGDERLLDRRSLVSLVADRTADLDHAIGDALDAHGMEWAAIQYREGRAGFAAFIPAEAFWSLVDSWIHVFCGQPRVPMRYVGGFSPT